MYGDISWKFHKDNFSSKQKWEHLSFLSNPIENVMNNSHKFHNNNTSRYS